MVQSKAGRWCVAAMAGVIALGIGVLGCEEEPNPGPPAPTGPGGPSDQAEPNEEPAASEPAAAIADPSAIVRA